MMEFDENILLKIGNRTPFHVPAGYFEQFETHLTKQIMPQNAQKSKIFAMRHWWSAAAAVALLFSVGLYSYRNYQERQLIENQEIYDTYLMSQIDNSDLIDYYLISYDE